MGSAFPAGGAEKWKRHTPKIHIHKQRVRVSVGGRLAHRQTVKKTVDEKKNTPLASGILLVSLSGSGTVVCHSLGENIYPSQQNAIPRPSTHTHRTMKHVAGGRKQPPRTGIDLFICLRTIGRRCDLNVSYFSCDTPERHSVCCYRSIATRQPGGIG